MKKLLRFLFGKQSPVPEVDQCAHLLPSMGQQFGVLASSSAPYLFFVRFMESRYKMRLTGRYFLVYKTDVLDGRHPVIAYGDYYKRTDYAEILHRCNELHIPVIYVPVVPVPDTPGIGGTEFPVTFKDDWFITFTLPKDKQS